MIDSPSMFNTKGFSIVEGLVSAAIVGTVAAGTAGLGAYLNKQSQRAQLLNRVVVLQSALQSAILDVNQYRTAANGGLDTGNNAVTVQRDAMVAAMVTGTKPNGFPLLRMSGDALNVAATSDVIAISGQRVFYTVDGQMSQTADAQHPIYVDLDYDCATLDAGCKAAYRIGFLPQPNQVPPSPLGAPLRSTSTSAVSFDSADYDVVVSYDAFKQAPMSKLPSETENIMITGMNRTSGAVTWVSKGNVAQGDHCPDGQIATTVQVSGDRLAFACHPLSMVECPTNYVLQELDFRLLDLGVPPNAAAAQAAAGPAPGLRGTCVYRWRNNIPWQSAGQDIPHTPTTGTVSVSAPVCNKDVYRVQPNGVCRAVTTVNTPGTCYDVCNCVTDNNGTQTCSTCPRTVYSNVSTNQGSISSSNVASCTLTITNQCGSSATAHPEWGGGTCVIKFPANLPPIPLGVLTSAQ